MKETNMEHSAEWYRGAVAVIGRMVDECQTVFDSDLPHITQGNLEDYLAEYAELLAAAEAREASQPTAAEVISKVRAELLKCLDNAKTLPQDARQAGVVAGWESAIDLLEALGGGSNDR